MRLHKREIRRIIILPFVAGLFLLLFPVRDQQILYQYEMGKPWTEDNVVSNSSFPIYKSEKQIQEEKEEIRSKFIPYFTFDSLVEKTNLIIMSPEEKEWIDKNKVKYINVVRGNTAKKYSTKKIYTPKSAYALKKKELLPNIHYDTEMSQRVLEEQLSQVSATQGMVQQGQKIIDKGEILTEEKYQILYSLLKNENKDSVTESSTSQLVGIYGLIVILIILFLLYLYKFRRRFYKSPRDMMFFITLSFLVDAISIISIHYNPILEYVIPFTWITILGNIFFDSRTALFLHLMNLLLVSCAVPHPYVFLIMQIIAGMVVVVSLKNLARRSQLVETASWVVLSYAITYTLCTAIVFSIDNINKYVYLLLILNGVLIICSYGIIFLFEKIFKKTSDITLVEIADINSKLLLYLAEKAPGTFQHSIQVSTLATVGAREIDANFLLVRTAALYHDIGKAANAMFFTENQQNNYNPLLEKTPQQAIEIIKQHVTNGISLVKEHNLPSSIIPFINSHHGTSVIRYFYNTAINNANKNGEDTSQIKEEDFRYPGPKPKSKEEAILMMADTIEARTRSIKDINATSVLEIVNDTIDMQIADGQFDETDLSFKDVQTLRKVFAEHILSINHQRISYPKIETTSQP